jgi:hypothetical protein
MCKGIYLDWCLNHSSWSHKAWVFMATTMRVLARTMSWNGHSTGTTMRIYQIQSNTFKQLVHTCGEQHRHKQRMPAHLTFLLGLYPLHWLHQKQGNQTSAYQGWYMVLQSPYSLVHKLSKKACTPYMVLGYQAWVFMATIRRVLETSML